MRIEITNRLGQALPHWLGGRAAYGRNKQEMRIMLGTIQTRRCYLLLVLLVLISFNSANGQTAAFTYQGRLTDGGTAAPTICNSSCLIRRPSGPAHRSRRQTGLPSH